MATRRRPNYELQRHVQQLKELDSARSQIALNRKLGAAFVAHVQENFEQKRDPAGRRWKKRTRDYPWPLMEKTGEMRGAWKKSNLRVTAQGWRIEVPGYTGYHQEGTKNMVARRVYPSRQLPDKLKRKYETIVTKHVENRLKKKK